jgi:hypothetical protein
VFIVSQREREREREEKEKEKEKVDKDKEQNKASIGHGDIAAFPQRSFGNYRRNVGSIYR